MQIPLRMACAEVKRMNRAERKLPPLWVERGPRKIGTCGSCLGCPGRVESQDLGCKGSRFMDTGLRALQWGVGFGIGGRGVGLPAGASSRNTPSPYVRPELTVDGGNLASRKEALLQFDGFVALWFAKVSLHQQYH